ncbi:hypothetical protein HPB49_013572 [Dermacentor silvarum]|uniref:Uncharacterized protein n=1 Tax=Dermacentor silvarum TaxID=543639 RepID=A0ACB8DDA4_DERSI|nr:hypothetical protein HPB49_013572 [Dermacentor silvarum]
MVSILHAGTGTFGRVCLCRDGSGAFHAMKILEISDVIRLKQVEHVKNEKAILLQVQHPFIIRMSWTHHDATCLYMLFEYVSGGELFTYLRNAGRFTSATGSFYAAEIVLALEYLHRMHIVYRDLKPENLLLDREGHLKITDFGFAKKLHDRSLSPSLSLSSFSDTLAYPDSFQTHFTRKTCLHD